MKIIIIGAGLSGLGTAIALRKCIKDTPIDIKIYDKAEHEDPSEDREQRRLRKLGAGLGLQSNGLNVLNDLDPSLRDKVYASGFPCDHFKWKTSGDALISREYVDVLSISRPLLIDCLLEHLPADIIEYKTVSKVFIREGQKPVIQFEDGSPDETADLLIGADGVGSLVRRTILGDEAEKYKPQYLGTCAVGGILNISLPQSFINDPSITFFMGSTGVFGYTGLSQSDTSKILYFSIYETDLPDRGREPDPELLIKQMRERHDDWTDPTTRKCLQQSRLDNIYPIFVMPELPHWGQNRCVLVGDAAHALPPRSGQGASQAFEDAQTLALLLDGHLARQRGSTSINEADAITKSIAAFYNVRHTRVYRIRSKAVAWKDPQMPMPWWKTYAMYFFIFLFVKVQYVLNLFDDTRTWDAKGAVREYFRGVEAT